MEKKESAEQSSMDSAVLNPGSLEDISMGVDFVVSQSSQQIIVGIHTHMHMNTKPSQDNHHSHKEHSLNSKGERKTVDVAHYIFYSEGCQLHFPLLFSLYVPFKLQRLRNKHKTLQNP